MPGLIDAHWHAIMARPSMMTAMTADFNYIQALAIAEAQATLLRGLPQCAIWAGRYLASNVRLTKRLRQDHAFIRQAHSFPRQAVTAISGCYMKSPARLRIR